MKKRWKLFSAAAIFAVAFTAFGIPAWKHLQGYSAADATVEWSDSGIEAEYDFGEEFTLPLRTVSIGEDAVSAETVLQYPDGSATKQAQVTLSQSGIYTLSYSARLGGKAYAQTESFTVNDDLYYVNSRNSSVTYGSYTTTHNGSTHENKPGLMVRLAEGDTLTFSKVIDVSDVTLSDVLVEGFATPDVVGQADFKRLFFTFTDAENPNIYMRVSCRQSAEGDNYPTTYYLAAGNSQPLTGWEAAWNRLHIDNEWGAQASHSFSLQYGANGTSWREPEEMPISLRYDASTLSVYTGATMIIDFDNPTYFNTLWRGFPSGKVRLSVTASMYNAETANFCITKVMGMDLTEEKFYDTEGPELTVDNEYETMPEALVGGSYPVPSATAKDIYSGVCEVQTSVWYNYTSENAVLVDIVNGRFDIDRAGTYAIVYDSADKQGNVSSSILWVHASDSLEKPTISLVGTPQTELSVGEVIELYDYEVQSFSGNPSVKVTVESEDGTQEIGAQGYRVEKAGEYTVTYTVSDYIGQTGTVTYVVNATIGDAPVFIDTPALPMVFIGGSEYTLPVFYAHDYAAGPSALLTAYAEITDAAGTRTVQAGETFVPTVSANGDTVKIVFQCEGAEYPEIFVPTILAWVEDASTGRPRLQIENYFYSENNDVSYTKNSDSVTVTAGTADGGWVFANDMLAYDFSVEVKGVVAKSNYESLKIVLMDAEDPDIRIETELMNYETETDIRIGNTELGLSGNLRTGSSYVIGFKNGYLTVDGINIAQVTETYDGKAFDGFPSGRLYVGIYFNGATAGDAYQVLDVNGHTINNSTTDRVSPKIVVYGDHGGSFEFGQTVTLAIADASDVVDPNVVISMTVTDGSGNVVKDINGVLLQNVDPRVEYQVKLESYGQYSVVISADDTFNQRANNRKYTYALNVDDDAAPEIEFSGDFVSTAKVGDVLIIPDFTVSDNITAAENIVVTKYVLTPNGVLVTLSGASNSIRTATAGEYEFRIIAMDEAGNITMVRKAITVTAV